MPDFSPDHSAIDFSGKREDAHPDLEFRDSDPVSGGDDSD
jgi:hypothetical protein